jgi:hypothetical protein
MNRLAFVTVATPDFLPAVCVLAESLREHEPDARLACYLVGDPAAVADCAGLPFETRRVDTLPIPAARRFFFQYDLKELCCALKPHLLADSLWRAQADAAVFLDADVLVCAPFAEMFRRHFEAHAVLLTPHLLEPIPAPHLPVILRAGVYNAGIVGVRAGADAARFLDWWQQRVARDCLRDPFGGLCSDQRWLDLAVGLFDFVRPLREAGVNVGYWNLHERDLTRAGAAIAVNGTQPLRLYHFSGITPGDLSRFIPPELDQRDWTVARELAESYRARLERAARDLTAAGADRPWERFSDGVPVTKACREAVRRSLVVCDDPFAERARVEAAAAMVGEWPRVTDWVERGPDALAAARAELQRLRAHPVIGTVLRFWRRWVNPTL